MASSSASTNNVNRGLQHLIEHAKNDVSCKKNPPRLSHYRVIPDNVKTAYDLLRQGAQLVRATSTKYALIGAIDRKEQTTLGNDLLRGCELIGAATHVTIQDSSGCSKAVRQYNQKAALSIYFATLRLVEAFHPEIRESSSIATETTIVIVPVPVASASAENNVGAQKTGAVWEACDHILNKQHIGYVPQGNRNAIRREIFTWTRECNDTMEEFQEMVDSGPREAAQDDGIEDENNDDFVDEQYTDDELPIAIACLGLVKISRGNMKVSLEILESIGNKANETQDNDEYLESISKVHEYARKVGVGITDLGSVMYPPLISSKNILDTEILKQAACIKESQDYILGLENIPTNISELANILRNAAETREREFFSALESCRT